MKIFQDKNSGRKFCINEGNECSDHIIEYGIFEMSLIEWAKQFLNKDSTFIDCGAHIGTYSIILSYHCKNVVSFEPQKDTYECLVVGISENNRFNILANNCAVGNEETEMVLSKVSLDGCGSTLCAVDKPILDIEIVKVKTLDSFDIKNVDLIKMDVEGFEINVFQGALETLKNNKYPPVIFKCWNTEEHKAEKTKLVTFVKSLGYTVYPIRGYDNMMLASDHPERPKPIVEEKSEKQETINIYKDIDKLVDQYNQGHLIKIDNWKDAYELAKHFRIHSKNDESYKCAHWALRLMRDKNNKYYEAENKSKEYLPYEEISIVTCYINKKTEGLHACEKLILSHDAPWHVKNLACSNQRYYMSKLAVDKIIEMKCINENSEILLKDGYVPSSPSIIKTDDGYMFNIRTINYVIDGQGKYTIHDDNDIIYTVNYVMNLDIDLKITHVEELVDFSGIKRYPKNIQGMEDVRIFDKGQAFCTYLETNDQRIPQISWINFNEAGIVNKVVPFMIGDEIKCEKNWLPFLDDGDIKLIYSFQPLVIYKINKESNDIVEIKREVISEFNLSGFRGSASPIPYKDGWICTVHDVYYNDNLRLYRHRFVWLNKDFTQIKFSLPFYFEKLAIEFNLSICHAHNFEGFLLTYSILDSCAKIAYVTYETIDKMIK